MMLIDCISLHRLGKQLAATMLLFAAACSSTFGAGAVSFGEPANVAAQSHPNFVIIVMDDLGYGDLGSYGSDIPTPNADRLASQGLLLTDFYAGSTNCSPSRAGLVTGRVPVRYGVNSVFFPQSFTGLPESEMTIAEMLKPEGYQSAWIGKWHLGHREKYLPLARGFDYYFGMPYSNDMHSPYLIRGNDVVDYTPDQSLITSQYTEEAVSFISQNAKAQTPFLLVLAHTMPHVPLYTSEPFEGVTGQGLYADVIAELDASIGTVVAALENAGLSENTMVVVTSDNGPWLEMEKLGGSAGVLRGGKHSSFDGGVRVPGIFYWPGEIEAGRVSETPASFFDLVPTIADLAGFELPSDREFDGHSLTKFLKSGGAIDRETFDYGYFEFGVPTAFRRDNWKVKFPHEGLYPHFYSVGWPGGHEPHGLMLFNLAEDPGERLNLAEEEPERLAQMMIAYEEYRARLGDVSPGLVIWGTQDSQGQDYRDENVRRLTDKLNQSEVAQ